MSVIVGCRCLLQVECFPGSLQLWFGAMPQTPHLQQAYSACVKLRKVIQPCWDVAVALAETADLTAEQQEAREQQLLAALAQWVSDPEGCDSDSAERVSLRAAGAGRYMGGGLLSLLSQQHPTNEASLPCQTKTDIMSDRLPGSSTGSLPSDGTADYVSSATVDANSLTASAATDVAAARLPDRLSATDLQLRSNESVTSDAQADAQYPSDDAMAADAITARNDDAVGVFGFRLPPPPPDITRNITYNITVDITYDSRGVFELTLQLERLLSRVSDHCQKNGIAFDKTTGLAAHLARYAVRSACCGLKLSPQHTSAAVEVTFCDFTRVTIDFKWPLLSV